MVLVCNMVLAGVLMNRGLLKNNLFVLKEVKRRKLGSTGIQDLDKPIYKILPSNLINSNVIVL